MGTSNPMAKTAHSKFKGANLASLFRNFPLAVEVTTCYVFRSCRAANAAFCSGVAAD